MHSYLHFGWEYYSTAAVVIIQYSDWAAKVIIVQHCLVDLSWHSGDATRHPVIMALTSLLKNTLKH